MPSRSQSSIPFLKIIAALLLLTGFIVVACNSAPNPVPTPIPTLIPTSPVQAQPCGVVATFGTIESVPTQSLVMSVQMSKCFWQAVQQCHPASLIYINPMGVVRVFMVEKSKQGSPCAISDILQKGQGSSQTRQVYPCSHVEAENNGEAALKFVGCGKDGDITIPINTMLQ
jgi:hypothetical protein